MKANADALLAAKECDVPVQGCGSAACTLLRCARGPVTRFPQDIALGHPIATVCFSAGAVQAGVVHAEPLAQLPIAPLALADSADAFYETWLVDGTVVDGQRNELRYRHNQEILFGVIQLSEAAFDTASVQAAGKTPLQQATEYAYREIFALMDALGFNSILRAWNYLADITGHSHGIERYRQFNSGRQDGFLGGGRGINHGVPAASAVGFAEGPLSVCFLAGRGVTPIAIENPRQISAYRYPADYGPRSPTFSRASVASIGSQKILFLSGTASIVGHQTLHRGDVLAQTRETLVNIAAVIAEANRVVPQAEFSIKDLCYKVYVRHASDVAAIRDVLRNSLGDAVQLLFLEADICRQDLLVEIEATAGHPCIAL